MNETLVREEGRESVILVARDDLTILQSRVRPGERIAGRHVHFEHTDAFYVLEGELTFVVGPDAERVRAAAGTFVAVPPGIVHTFANEGDAEARWLNMHTPDGGFAAFMRGLRDGVEVEWDFAPVPADGGRSAADAVIAGVS